MRTTTLSLLIASLMLPGSALAQSRVAPDETGTGGGPRSTITAPNTNSLGVTKPPGTSMGPGEVPSSRERRRERALTNRIDNSICDGCN
ncbi:hypothetical protein [Methylobacterium sp. J-067]|uniref:hypothetical protein n=1 Tax=Methylobacterium sp. J-067 TaxID=2836648 RepID=UPI001FBA2F04|nr:hypothetical protein [Methylobacterium sp. J-067]MCJ2023319.1 hypothetical protein [Methylobacterium sp. J-067]